jgi:hypothetical protein
VKNKKELLAEFWNLAEECALIGASGHFPPEAKLLRAEELKALLLDRPPTSALGWIEETAEQYRGVREIVLEDKSKISQTSYSFPFQLARIILKEHAPPRLIDGKFGIFSGKIVNLVSGEVIPEDEPLFLFRGRDPFAMRALVLYLAECGAGGCNDLHQAGITQALQKFGTFAREHSERMKQPGVTRHLKLTEPVSIEKRIEAGQDIPQSCDDPPCPAPNMCRLAGVCATKVPEKKA